MKNEQTCATCLWYEYCDDETRACYNEGSQNWGEYMLPDNSCEAWEEKDE